MGPLFQLCRGQKNLILHLWLQSSAPKLYMEFTGGSFYWACHAEDILPDPLQMSHACHRFRKCNKTLTFCSLWQHAESLAPATQNYIWRSKSAPNPSVFTLLSSKCASCHHGVHFFDISTSKSGPSMVCLCTFSLANAPLCHNCVHFFDMTTSKNAPNLVCFVHFDLEICFAPQRCAIFHRSSGPHLLFDPPEPQIIGKHRESCLFYLFTHLHLLSSDSFSSLIFSLPLFLLWLFPPLLFHLSTLSEVWLLNFLW